MASNEVWFTRKGAALYLTSIGCRMTHTYLSKLALPENKNKGPKFVRSGWRTTNYAKSVLDAWAKERMKDCG